MSIPSELGKQNSKLIDWVKSEVGIRFDNEFAKKLGYANANMIYNYRCGNSEVGYSFMGKVHDAFGLSIDDMVKIKGA